MNVSWYLDGQPLDYQRINVKNVAPDNSTILLTQSRKYTKIPGHTGHTICAQNILNKAKKTRRFDAGVTDLKEAE